MAASRRRDDDDRDDDRDDDDDRPRRRSGKASGDRVTILEGNPARNWLKTFGADSDDDDDDDDDDGRPAKRTSGSTRRGYFDRR